MVFSSVTFLFVFLPLFLAAYALLPWQNLVALVFSLLFYAWGEGAYVLLLLATVFVNYLVGNHIQKDRARRLYLGIGVAFNLLILCYFKYFGFLVADVLQLDIPPADLPHLPLGISFFIFQSISYLVDVYRGNAVKAHSFSDLALYIAMFPQLIAGPIVRYGAVSDAIQHRHIGLDQVRSGAMLFLAGLCWKVLIANNVAEVADTSFALDQGELDSLSAWLGIIAYTIQIYFDFGGYSLMAIGIGRIMGFEFPPNFNYPYISASITEFWRRWHMSLSSWFRDYLYIPLGGNRKGPIRTYANLLIVFLLCGLWHGAAWTFVVWGLFHGSLLVIERFGLGGLLNRLPRPAATAYTLLMVMIGLVLFRSETFVQAGFYYSAMFLGGAEVERTLAEIVTNENLFWGALGVILSAPIVPWLLERLRVRVVSNPALKAYGTSAYSLLMLALFFLCTIYVMSGTYNPFIYFRF